MTSESEFLKTYNVNEYERPSVTSDIVIFKIRRQSKGSYRKNAEGILTLLLIRRGGHPFKGCWALPGGFLEPNETIEECALREVTEETGITPNVLMPVAVFSAPGRDPRGWIISNAFTSILSENSVTAVGRSDAAEADWFDIQLEETKSGKLLLSLSNENENISAVLREKENRFGLPKFEIENSGGLAFDHAAIIATSLRALQARIKNFEYIFDFLPEKFTLTALQEVQETVMNIEVLPANFRRKIADYVEDTGEYSLGSGHRPAKLFRKKAQTKASGSKNEII